MKSSARKGGSPKFVKTSTVQKANKMYVGGKAAGLGRKAVTRNIVGAAAATMYEGVKELEKAQKRSVKRAKKEAESRGVDVQKLRKEYKKVNRLKNRPATGGPNKKKNKSK